MQYLNYHHLRYFRTIARERNLTRAAAALKVSAPALSVQLRQLEHSLGHALFDRHRKGLNLTEAGRLALDYAETIFRTGEELQDALQNRPRGGRQLLRIGAVSTLSRNFQLGFLRPVLHRPDVELVLRSGPLRGLLLLAHAHQIDLVLCNQPVRREAEMPWHSHLLEEQPVSLVGGPRWRRRAFVFPRDCAEVPLLVPSHESETRAAFDRVMEASGIRPLIAAEVDDMAMLRLLAREGDGLALVPPVVVRDEIATGRIVEKHRIREVKERFYGITLTRRFPNPLVRELIESSASGASA
jgi:LysR family transcriptional activator of nhaA